MKITLELLKKYNICLEGINWFKEQKSEDPIKLIKNALIDGHFEWCSYLSTKILSRKQNIKYAAFASELMLPIFELSYLGDSRPRKAVEAIKQDLDSCIATKVNSAIICNVFDAYWDATCENMSAAYAAYAAYTTARILYVKAIYPNYESCFGARNAIDCVSLATSTYDSIRAIDIRTQILHYGLDLIIHNLKT